MKKFENVEEYVSHLTDLLELEENYEINEFNELLNNTSNSEKVESGILWKSCELVNLEHPLPERSLLELKKREDNIPPAFSPGSPVKIFRDREEIVEGTLTYLKGNTAKILFFNDEIPDFIEEGSFSMELSFNEISYKAMKFALQEMKTTQNKRFLGLRDKLLGFKNTEFQNYDFQPVSGLNSSQNSAIQKAINSQDFFILHGPPGTGKTTTLVELTERLVNEMGEKVMICTASNVAADLIIEKLLKKSIYTTRLGNPARVSESVFQSCLESRVSLDSDDKNVKKKKKRAHEILRKAKKFKRKFGKKEREERARMKKDAYVYLDQAKEIEKNIYKRIYDSSNVIVSTLTGVFQNPVLKHLGFSTVIVDEATQALEPAIWLAVLLAPTKRIVFAGDPFQLPPTVKSPEAVKGGLQISFLERLLEIHTSSELTSLLSIQYRMNDEIMGFPNLSFYKKQLVSGPGNAHWELPFEGISGKKHILFIDTVGADYYEEKEEESESLFNLGEKEILTKIISDYREENERTAEKISIGVLSPYRSQVKKFRESLPSAIDDPFVFIDTIDSFQGSEKDVIFISLVRSNDEGEIGFLEDTRRMNVAISRARKELILIGNSETISRNSFYRSFLEYVREMDAIRSVWDFIE